MIRRSPRWRTPKAQRVIRPLVPLLLLTVLGVLLPASPASAAGEPGNGPVGTGAVVSLTGGTYEGLRDEVVPKPTRWWIESTSGETAVVSVGGKTARVFNMPLTINGESPGESYASGEGSVTSLVMADDMVSIVGSGRYTRQASHLTLTADVTVEVCPSPGDCASGSGILVMGLDFLNLSPNEMGVSPRGCAVGFCVVGGVFTLGPDQAYEPSGNQAPLPPELIAPPEAHVASQAGAHLFSLRAEDPEDDPYTAEVTIRDDAGAVVSRFPTLAAASGNDAAGQKVGLSPGRYTWTARATDAWGAEGPESAPRTFEVLADERVEDPLTAIAGESPIRRLSLSTAGREVDTGSFSPDVSGDGRYVAFNGDPSLVPGSTCGLFMHDRATGSTACVSPGGMYPDLSGDGRYIAYEKGNPSQVYVHDRASGVESLVSRTSTGTPGNARSTDAAISADGRFVAFESEASNLVSGDPTGAWPPDVFLYDRELNTTTRLADGTCGGSSPSISADGRYVAFNRRDCVGAALYDRTAGTFTLLRVKNEDGRGSIDGAFPQLSADGRYVAMTALLDRFDGDPDMAVDVVRYDRQTDTTVRVSVREDGTPLAESARNPSISADGRFVAFTSPLHHLPPFATVWYDDVYVYDHEGGYQIPQLGCGSGVLVCWRTIGKTARVSRDRLGDDGGNSPEDLDDHPSGIPYGCNLAWTCSDDASISATGYVVFSSYASDLVPGDTNNNVDIFGRELVPGAACEDYVLPVGTPFGCAGPEADNPRSDRVGLEDFYPYEAFELGSDERALVNMATGNLVVQGTDFETPGQGLNLRLGRTYNAIADDRDGPLGRGWSLGIVEGEADTDLLETVQSALYANDLGQVAEVLGHADMFDFIDGDGTRHHFVKREGAWHAPPGVNLTVTDRIDNQGNRWYRLTRPDGVTYEFRPVGVDYRATRVDDRVGNAVTFTYTPADGRLQTVTDTRGRTLSFTWAGAYLSRVRYAASGQTLDVTYSVNPSTKRLESVTQAAGTTSARTITFSYGTDGLSGVTDARGHDTGLTSTDGRLTTLRDRVGRTWTFAYGTGACEAAAGLDTSASCVSDPEGNREIWWISPEGNLVHHRDAGDADVAGNPRFNDPSYVWSDNRLVRETDEAGNVTEYAYDDVGLVTEVSRRVGSGDDPVTTQLEYDEPVFGVGEVRRVVAGAASADERVWTFDHDGAGNLTRTTDPLGHATTLSYYAGGLLKSVTDANGRTTTYGNVASPNGDYDASGQPTRIIDPTGAAMTVAYDFLGRPTTLTDRTNATRQVEYDLRGNVVQEVDPLGRYTVHCYDANDNEIITWGPRAVPYPCELADEFSSVIQRTYYDHDLPHTVASSSDGQIRKTRYTYFDDGQLAKIFEPRSFTTTDRTNFDVIGAGQVASYTYHPNNRLKTFVDEEGARTDFVHTPHGLLRRVTSPSSGAPERASVTYDYNRYGQLTTELVSGRSQPTTHRYNAHGERIRTTDPYGSVTNFQYDKAGRLTRVTDAMGSVTTRAYDPVGNLTELRQPTGDGEHTVTSYTYTSRDEIETESDPADAAHTVDYQYDAEGRQRFRRDRYDGAVERTVEQRYDVGGRLTEEIASLPGTNTGTHRATYGYDADGNRTAVDTYLDGAAEPNVSSIRATYTSTNELATWEETIYAPSTSVTRTSSFAYGADGLLTNRTVDGNATSYEYLRNGVETSADPWGGGTITNEYYDSGKLKRRALPNGVVLSQEFDLSDQLRSRVFAKGGTTLSGWSPILYTETGYRTHEFVTQRQPSGHTEQGSAGYSYDRLDRLSAYSPPWAPPPEQARFVYRMDDAGNVLNDLAYSYTYEANRLVSRTKADPLGDILYTYAYDHFGNQVEETRTEGTETTTKQYSYDAAFHTRQAVLGDGTTITYAYDGLDRLVRRTKGETTTLFFRDGPSGQVVLETDAAGTATTRYVLSGTGEPLAQDRSSQSGRGYFVSDPRGNVTQLLDDAGGVRSTFAYDPCGADRPALANQTANWDSRLRFQMAPKDPDLGAYALGPRLYDPSINRFVGVDHYVGATANMDLQLDPLTGNRYMYAGANPVNLVDDGYGPSCPNWLRWACEAAGRVGHVVWGTIRNAAQSAWSALKAAARWGLDNYTTVIGAASSVACIAGTAGMCAAGLTAAFVARTIKRMRGGGWDASWKYILADLTYTGASFFLVKLPGKFLVQSEMAKGGWAVAHRAASTYLQLIVNPEFAYKLSCSTVYEDPARDRPPMCL